MAIEEAYAAPITTPNELEDFEPVPLTTSVGRRRHPEQRILEERGAEPLTILRSFANARKVAILLDGREAAVKLARRVASLGLGPWPRFRVPRFVWGIVSRGAHPSEMNARIPQHGYL